MKQAGGMLLVLATIAILYHHQGRWAAPDLERPPALSVGEGGKITVGLGEGFPVPGIHHFSDAVTAGSVIEMTGLRLAAEEGMARVAQQQLGTGERLSVRLVDGQVVEITKSELPAHERILLGIPLDPDRMTRRDWESLPGVGPRLAEEIVKDRQNNGAFGSLEGLLRVKGIGVKRLATWRPYFSGSPPPK